MYIFRSLKLQISSRNCAWLVSIILLNVLIFLFLHRAPWPSPQLHRQFEPQTNNNDNNNNNNSYDSNNNNNNCIFGKVYVYDLPSILNKDLINNSMSLSNNGFGRQATGLDRIVPQNLTPAWYWTDLYAAEVIYHHRMLNHICRTTNQDHATAFYIPFYAGLAVERYLWLNHTAKQIDFYAETMLKWIQNQLPWKRTYGSDHFIVLGRLTWDFRRITRNSDKEWGTSLLNMPLMKNVLHLTPERSIWDENEFSVPYPNPFHPKSQSQIHHWQTIVRARQRSTIFSFVGGTRKNIKRDFRSVILNYCKNETGSCRFVDCSVTHCYDGASATIEAFMDTDFCLQPKGDGFTRRATFDCMLGGGIPVFFWNGSFENQYKWHLPAAAESYSVFIDNKEVRRDPMIIKRVLEKYSREDVKRMREVVIDFMPNILIAAADANMGSVRDAFDISLDGVLGRFKQLKQGIS